MFSYLYDGVEHTDTSTDYCAKLGMTDEQTRSVQQDALAHSANQWLMIRTERLKRIYEIEWRIHRMFREDKLGLPRTDSDETMQAMHEYMQALADLPQQFNTPDAVVWPVLNI